jgi:uncharacterized membrane protein
MFSRFVKENVEQLPLWITVVGSGASIFFVVYSLITREIFLRGANITVEKFPLLYWGVIFLSSIFVILILIVLIKQISLKLGKSRKKK